MRVAWILLIAVVISGSVWGQTAQVVIAAIVNSASQESAAARPTLAPGSLATIYGTGFSAVSSVGSAPFPNTLAGVTVRVNGVVAPLLFVSPTQINFQVPSNIVSLSSCSSPCSGAESAQRTSVSLSVDSSVGKSASLSVPLEFSAPGVFTTGQTGCGNAAALNIDANGKVTVNGPQNSASPGDFLTVFETGEGLGQNDPLDGVAAPISPLAGNSNSWLAVFDEEPIHHGYLRTNSIGFLFSGKAPGLVGVDQSNLLVPPLVREGCAVPLRIGPGRLVYVSIKNGGGQCVDPPSTRSASVTLQSTVIVNQGSLTPENLLTASFVSSPSPAVSQKSDYVTTPVYDGPACSIPGYSLLSAGQLVLAAPSGFVSKANPLADGTYSTPVLGPLEGGKYIVTAEGSPQVNAFTAEIDVPAPIRILSSYPMGTHLSSGPPISVQWEGGAANQSVTLRMVSHDYKGNFEQSETVAGDAGYVAFSQVSSPKSGPQNVVPVSNNIELVVEVNPRPVDTSDQILLGLTQEANVRWQYRFIFKDLQY